MQRKTKCYSIRLKSLDDISIKAFKATAFDGSECYTPKSLVFGQDFDVIKSDAYWVAAWFLEKDDVKLQCSFKKVGWYNPNNGSVEPPYPEIIIEKHVPEKINPIESNYINELKK